MEVTATRRPATLYPADLEDPDSAGGSSCRARTTKASLFAHRQGSSGHGFQFHRFGGGLWRSSNEVQDEEIAAGDASVAYSHPGPRLCGKDRGGPRGRSGFRSLGNLLHSVTSGFPWGTIDQPALTAHACPYPSLADGDRNVLSDGENVVSPELIGGRGRVDAMPGWMEAPLPIVKPPSPPVYYGVCGVSWFPIPPGEGD